MVDAAATRSHVPALLLVAIVENESRWRAGAYNRSGAAGLGGVMPRGVPACAGQAIPCAALLNPDINLRAAASILRQNYRYCARTARPSWERALAGYQTGRCGPIKLTATVVARWAQIERVAFRQSIR